MGSGRDVDGDDERVDEECRRLYFQLLETFYILITPFDPEHLHYLEIYQAWGFWAGWSPGVTLDNVREMIAFENGVF